MKDILHNILSILVLLIMIGIAVYICQRNIWYIIGFVIVILCAILDYLDGYIIHTFMKGGKDTWIEAIIAIYTFTVALYIKNCVLFL